MKKRFFYAIPIVIALLLMTAVAGYIHGSMRRGDIPFTVHKTEINSSVKLGEKVTLTSDITAPVCAVPEDISVSSPANLTVSGKPEMHISAYRWNRLTRKLTVYLFPLEPGEDKPGEVTVKFRNPDKTVTIPIPAVTVLPAESDGGALTLAGEIVPDKAAAKSWVYITAAAVMTILAAVAFILWRKRRRERIAPPLPPWERAAAELSGLRSDILNKRISLAAAFVRLTDLVRNYLEERYALPASTQTTEEFLEELNASYSTLPEEERPFLRSFMQSSELVKFAKMPPEEAGLIKAVDGAEMLIKHSAVLENGGNENV